MLIGLVNFPFKRIEHINNDLVVDQRCHSSLTCPEDDIGIVALAFRYQLFLYDRPKMSNNVVLAFIFMHFVKNVDGSLQFRLSYVFHLENLMTTKFPGIFLSNFKKFSNRFFDIFDDISGTSQLSEIYFIPKYHSTKGLSNGV